MRLLPFLLIAANAVAQSAPRIQMSHTSESLRGASAVSHEVAWASGTHGTYLRTIDGGQAWTPAQVPDAATLDFRGVVAFSADEAFLMSSGPGDQSRIYHTADAGRHWQLQFTNTDPKGFFDSMVFWDRTHGVVLGDPIPDEYGHLKFELLLTDDGQTWRPIPPAQLPPAREGEGAFAASNTCLAILRDSVGMKNSIWGQPSSGVQPGEARQFRSHRIPNSDFAILSETLSYPLGLEASWKSGASAPRQQKATEGASAPDGPDPKIWFASGGKAARVFHSADRGQTWQVFDTPILHGPDSAGIFSIAFRDALHGVIAGGDHKRPNDDGPNLAFTDDGGKTWTLSPIHPQAYFSSAAYDHKVNGEAVREKANEAVASATRRKRLNIKPVPPQRIFLVGQDFLFDFRPPANPRRISSPKKFGIKFNAVSPYPEGGALIVGPKGLIATVP